MPWYVLYTKPRNEKKTALLLAAKGVEVYCPVHEVVKQWSDRKKKIQEPVFRSYIFVHLKDYENEQVEVLRTAGAVRFLWWLGKPGIVRDTEIKAIQDFLNEYKGSAISFEITEGAQVTIMEGALREQTGKVTRIKGSKAYLHISSLGWNIIAELPIQTLRRQQ